MWISDLTRFCAKNAYIVLIGNKNDIENDREVSETEVQEFAKRNNLRYLETSAKTDSNLEDIFIRLGQRIHRSIKQNEIMMENLIFDELNDI